MRCVDRAPLPTSTVRASVTDTTSRSRPLCIMVRSPDWHSNNDIKIAATFGYCVSQLLPSPTLPFLSPTTFSSHFSSTQQTPLANPLSGLPDHILGDLVLHSVQPPHLETHLLPRAALRVGDGQPGEKGLGEGGVHKLVLRTGEGEDLFAPAEREVKQGGGGTSGVSTLSRRKIRPKALSHRIADSLRIPLSPSVIPAIRRIPLPHQPLQTTRHRGWAIGLEALLCAEFEETLVVWHADHAHPNRHARVVLENVPDRVASEGLARDAVDADDAVVLREEVGGEEGDDV